MKNVQSAFQHFARIHGANDTTIRGNTVLVRGYPVATVENGKTTYPYRDSKDSRKSPNFQHIHM